MDTTDNRRFQRQRSCACLPLDAVGSLCSSRRGSVGFARMQYSDDDEECYGYCEEQKAEESDRAPPPFGRRLQQGRRWPSHPGTRLRRLWRRIVEEKRNIVRAPAVAGRKASPLSYDAYAYAQNFDEGAAWAEPENLTRSFSARFAVPSRVVQELS